MRSSARCFGWSERRRRLRIAQEPAAGTAPSCASSGERSAVSRRWPFGHPQRHRPPHCAARDPLFPTGFRPITLPIGLSGRAFDTLPIGRVDLNLAGIVPLRRPSRSSEICDRLLVEDGVTRRADNPEHGSARAKPPRSYTRSGAWGGDRFSRTGGMSPSHCELFDQCEMPPPIPGP